MNGLSLTKSSSSFGILIEYINLFVLILMWTLFDLLFYKEHTMAISIFHSLLFVEQTCNNISSK